MFAVDIRGLWLERQRLATVTCSAIAVLFLGGCRPDEAITRTTEAHVELRKPKNPNSEKRLRILGAIAPDAEGQSWFFKLSGSPEEIEKHVKEFDEFLASLRFGDGPKSKPVDWTLPAGWQEGPKKGRYATILIGKSDEPLELTVLLLGGSLIENVNRWRGQVSLDAVKAEAIGSVSREVTTKQGRKITRVDFSGVASEKAMMPPFMKK